MDYRLPLEEFLEQVASHPEQAYLHQPDNGNWRTLSWAEVDNQARRIASGLLAQGYQAGARIGILSKNCAEWFITDIAISMAGLISVPIYPSAEGRTIEHVLAHSSIQTVFVGKLDNTKFADQALGSSVLRIAMPYPTVSAQADWQSWLATYPPLHQVAQPSPDATMSIVYTSGSTGLPKGVVLTYKNIAVSAKTSVDQLAVQNDDRYLSYLPLAHITERAIIEWTSVYAGNNVFFVESLDTFIDDVKYARPTLFISAPRLWTKFQAEILTKLPDQKLQHLLRIPIIGSLIAYKIRASLGLDKCRLFGSGTAPISPNVLQWYSRLKINISEGWGMTETAGLSCVAIPFEQQLIGSIGRPVACVEMKLSSDGEILIRGDSVFQEYYRDPETTAESFTEGWFHTGDRGSCSDDGVYKIIGRIKEQFKTGKGKYVAPAPIESLLGRNPDIEQVCVIGSGRKQPIALIVLNDQFNVPEDSTHQRLLKTFIDVNKELEGHQRLDHLIICNEAWTVENHLLTPTLKIRRHKLEERYAHFIDAELDDSVVWQAQLN